MNRWKGRIEWLGKRLELTGSSDFFGEYEFHIDFVDTLGTFRLFAKERKYGRSNSTAMTTQTQRKNKKSWDITKIDVPCVERHKRQAQSRLLEEKFVP
jgi:hypothetical protein